jgi:predicted transcriptional regulator
LEKRHRAVSHVCKIFAEVLDDIARAPQRRKHVNKTEHLHLECLVTHGERHHALVKAGLAEDRFGVLVDEVEYL